VGADLDRERWLELFTRSIENPLRPPRRAGVARSVDEWLEAVWEARDRELGIVRHTPEPEQATWSESALYELPEVTREGAAAPYVQQQQQVAEPEAKTMRRGN
jgi:hypothetical protein